jgi:hypothetical protein
MAFEAELLHSPLPNGKTVRLTQLDGKLPNLALAKLSAYHRRKGDRVVFKRSAQRDLLEPTYDVVYGSAIFTRSQPLIASLKREFPGAIVGGTGSGNWTTVETLIGDEFNEYDYSPWNEYPNFYPHSIGFTMRGCRLRCGHCVVPQKEGGPRANATIRDIWRGPGHPKNIVLLDNDFFGQTQVDWEARCSEILDGGYKVSFNQGINVRIITDAAAAAIARLPYFDDNFTRRRIYTAFDNAKDERIFRTGVERLLRAGVKGDEILSYMLVGYDGRETDESIFHRIEVMKEYGIRPYPMVYQPFDPNEINVPADFDFRRAAPSLNDDVISLLVHARPKNTGAIRALEALSPADRETAAEAVAETGRARYRYLKDIQRWLIRRHYHFMSFEDYRAAPEGRRRDIHQQTRSFFDDVP